MYGCLGHPPQATSPKPSAHALPRSALGAISVTRAGAEDYITGTQNGLFTAPRVVSAVAGVDGKVTVVIERGSPAPPTLTAVMTNQSGTWLASDLASGIGPSASIFSANPNC